MTVRRSMSVVAACFAVFVGGCSERQAPLPSEIDEPLYVQAKQLMKQGRHPEALTYFLKVIDRRGERGAPESHLEAGSIYLTQTKDPVEAYHHFRKYLELQPNSKEAAGVKGKLGDAQREFMRTLATRSLDDQSMKLQAEEAIMRLQRENDELRAQVATLRGGGASAMARPPLISVPDEAQTRSVPPPVATIADGSGSTPSITAPSPSPTPSARSTAPTPSTAAGSLFNTPGASPTATPTRPAVQPSRPNTAAANPPPAAPAATASARTHTVAPKETLYGISVKYYSNGRQMKTIYQANRDVMRNETDVRPGMVLRIPPPDAAAAAAAPSSRR